MMWLTCCISSVGKGANRCPRKGANSKLISVFIYLFLLCVLVMICGRPFELSFKRKVCSGDGS